MSRAPVRNEAALADFLHAARCKEDAEREARAATEEVVVALPAWVVVDLAMAADLGIQSGETVEAVRRAVAEIQRLRGSRGARLHG